MPERFSYNEFNFSNYDTEMVIKLVVFDVDGTLTKHSSIWWRLHEYFGTQKLGKKYYDEYFAGLIDYKEWARLDAELWKGRHVSEVIRVVNETELVPGAKEAIAELKHRGLHVAILSGGLDIMANNIAKRLGIEYVLTNRLIVNDDRLAGEVEILVGWAEKAKELKQIANHFKVSLDETAYVGDGKNDVSAFKVAGLSIAFMPEYDEVADAADKVILKNDLREILKVI